MIVIPHACDFVQLGFDAMFLESGHLIGFSEKYPISRIDTPSYYDVIPVVDLPRPTYVGKWKLNHQLSLNHIGIKGIVRLGFDQIHTDRTLISAAISPEE